MDIFKIIILSVSSFIVLFILTKLMGKLALHSIKARRFISGSSLILYDNGKIFSKNLKKSKMDLNEFLMQCRTNGCFNLSDNQTAILESNGKLSFIPNV